MIKKKHVNNHVALCPIVTSSIRFGVGRASQHCKRVEVVLECGYPIWQPKHPKYLLPELLQARELYEEADEGSYSVSQDKEICSLVSKITSVCYINGGRRYVDDTAEREVFEPTSLEVFAVSFPGDFLPTISACAVFNLPTSVSFGSSEFERQAVHSHLDLSVQFAFRLQTKDPASAASGFRKLQELQEAAELSLACAFPV